jgi:hypothetical protein
MLINGPVEAERRKLTIVGAAVALCFAVTVLLVMAHPFGGRAADLISVVIDTPYVGQGVADGTAIVMHGVTIGQITSTASRPGGGVRLNADLQKKPIGGLTDTMHIDFQPINYFGVTGINLIAGTGGKALQDGMHINTEPTGNFTLQALLSRLGQVSIGALTPKLIQVIDRATRYTDALDPLIETALIAANAIAHVQTVSTAQLLANATGITAVFPGFVDATMDAGDDLQHYVDYAHFDLLDQNDEDFKNKSNATQEEASKGLFAAVGKLEATHVDDLLPMVDTVRALTDVVPPLIRPDGFVQTLAEVRSRFEKMYGGTAEQWALQVRIVLDSLPGVAAPLAAAGAPS